MPLPEIGEKAKKAFPLLLERLRETPYFVISGTALGLWRDGDLIPTDTDLDFAYTRDSITNTEIQKLLHDFPCEFNTHGQLIFEKDGLIIDFTFLFPEQGGWEFRSPRRILVKRKCFDEPQMVKTKYGEVRFPGEIEWFFEQKYGSDWRTPKYQQKAVWAKKE